MAQQVQERINIRMKGLDDVFHRMIIALERLESFLEHERSGKSEFQLTAINTDRDLHDDKQNPPTRESVLAEVQLQCSALFFQTKFDDPELFERTMRYFLTDLLEWYGGRGADIPYNEVEMFVLPIITSLSRQINSVMDIMETTDRYVTKLRRIEDFTDEEKEQAVEAGFTAFLKAQHITGEQLQAFAESGADVQLTAHRRGTVAEGYQRLMNAMRTLYTETTPATTVERICNAYIEGLPTLEQPTEQPAEQPVEQPKEQPAEQPAEPANDCDEQKEQQTDEAKEESEGEEKKGILDRFFSGLKK